MRPTDRLFQIIQILRRSTQPTTAAALAEELEVSKRTVYRDIAQLIGQRIPIEGEAGFGYVLASDYDLPPLMFTPDEIEAIMLGAQWVIGRPDADLSKAACDVIAKIAAVIPEHLQSFMAVPGVGPKPAIGVRADGIDMAMLRAAIRGGRKLSLRYRSEAGQESDRTVWPVLLGYDEAQCLLIAWCELREDFRHFRADRMIAAEMLEVGHGLRRSDLRQRYLRWREAALAASHVVESA